MFAIRGLEVFSIRGRGSIHTAQSKDIGTPLRPKYVTYTHMDHLGVWDLQSAQNYGINPKMWGLKARTLGYFGGAGTQYV